MPIIRRFRTILTARLLLEYRDHYLYLAQTKSNGNSYTLPGGKIEGEEYAKEALIRETFEEAGIHLNKKSLKLVHIVYKRLHSTTEIIFFFRATSWTGDPEAKEPDKFKSTAWFPIDEPPKRLPLIIQFAMLKIAKGKIFSEFPPTKLKKKELDTSETPKIKAKSKPKKKTKKNTVKKANLKEKVKTKDKDKNKTKKKNNNVNEKPDTSTEGEDFSI